MKKMIVVMIMALVAVFMFTAGSSAQEAAAVVGTGSQGWDIALGIALPIILALSSFLANFFTIKTTDAPALIAVKKIINLLALNLSPNAGK